MKYLLILVLSLSLFIEQALAAGKIVYKIEKLTLTTAETGTVAFDLSSATLEGFFKNRVIVYAHTGNTLNDSDVITMYAKPGDKLSTINFYDNTTSTIFTATGADSIEVYTNLALPTTTKQGSLYEVVALPPCNYLTETITYTGTAGDSIDVYIVLGYHVGQ